MSAFQIVQVQTINDFTTVSFSLFDNYTMIASVVAVHRWSLVLSPLFVSCVFRFITLCLEFRILSRCAYGKPSSNLYFSPCVTSTLPLPKDGNSVHRYAGS